MRRRSVPIASARILVGAAVILILLFTYLQGDGGHSPFDFFGYFTNLTSALSSGLLITTGGMALLQRPASRWLVLARGVSVASSPRSTTCSCPAPAPHRRG